MQTHYHFSKIAEKYRNLRRTDLEPILYIEKKLRKLTKIEAADIGCGDGRYNLKLFEHLDGRLFLHCVDSNKKMLEQLETYLIQHKIKNFQIIETFASKLPLEDSSLDGVFTFNAIHHFPLLAFLKEASRVLKDDGYLFIYTRSREQNSKNIWGRYFPLFTQKETRLYDLDGLESVLREVLRLKIESTEVFEYKRVSTLDWLVEQAEEHHYSTFDLYTKTEFEESLDKFKRNLKDRFKYLENITWFDQNVLLVIRNQAA